MGRISNKNNVAVGQGGQRLFSTTKPPQLEVFGFAVIRGQRIRDMTMPLGSNSLANRL